MKRLIAGVAIASIAFVAVGCTDKNTEPYNDAPRGGQENSGPARVIMFPDGFSNAATKCDHGNRVYVVYKGDANRAALSVVPHDPTCRGDRSTDVNP